MVNLSSKTIIGLVRISRPLHWTKNLGLFAALVLFGGLFDQTLFKQVFWAFLVFNIATSATYAFNDAFDVKLDRLHPTKKKRPVAKGDISVPLALLYSASLAMVALIWASFFSHLFFFMVGFYLIIQIAYSSYLKNTYIIDILIIATGFVIRVYSGAFIINAHLSVWFLLTVISVALFLAAGKRRAEFGVTMPGQTRKSMARYSKELLNSYVTMFGNAAWMSWALFTFFESPKASVPFWILLAELSQTIAINKLLMITIPVSIFGIMRYQSLIFEGRTESPEKLFLKDIPLMASIIVWASLAIWILYGGVAV